MAAEVLCGQGWLLLPRITRNATLQRLHQEDLPDMDVPAAATAVSSSLPPISPAPDPGTPVPASSTGSGSSGPAAATLAGTATSAGVAPTGLPGSSTPAPADAQPDGSIKPVVAKLFNTSSANISVSFQVVKGLNEVVTVFTDKTTGKEIVQFPSQQLIALAEFFNKLAGNVLDKTA